MAGFQDFLQAIQFGAGLAGGFAVQSQQERAKNESTQLALMRLLKDQEQDIVPVAPEEAGGQGALQALFGVGGPGNLFRVGGQAFRVQPKPMLGGFEDIGVGPGVAPVAPPVPAAPVPSYRPFAPSVPAPLEAPEVPGVPRAPVRGAPTVAQRHNNPLNIKYGPLTKKYVESGEATIGEPATDGGRFLRFASATTGVQAAQDLLDQPLYANRTVDAALKTWSGNGYGGEIVKDHIDPETKVSDLTPEQKITLVQNMAQAEGAPGVSQMVAGPGAPPVSLPPVEVVAGRVTPTPEAIGVAPTPPGRVTPPEIQIPAAATLEQRQEQARRIVINRFAQMPATLQNQARRQAAVAQAETRTEQEYDRELKTVQASADKLKKTGIHNFAILDALEQATTYGQLAHIRQVIQQTPDEDHLGDAVGLLNQTPVDQRGEMAARLMPQLLRANYTEQQISQGFKRVLTAVDLKEAITKERAMEKERTAGAMEREKQLGPMRTAEAVAREKAVEPVRTEETIARMQRERAEVPTTATDLPNRIAREQFGLPSFAAATQEQASTINRMVEDRESMARLNDTEQKLRLQADLKSTERDISEVPVEKMQYYLDRKTLKPFNEVLTWGELRKRNPIPVSAKTADTLKEYTPLRAISEEIKELVGKVYGPGGPLEMVSQEKGAGGRLSGDLARRVVNLKQSDPLVRVLDERLREFGVQAARTLEGLRGRPAYQLMKPALDVRPSLGEAGAFGVFGGRMPDTRETILAQVHGAEKLMNRIISETLGTPITAQKPTGTPSIATPAVPGTAPGAAGGGAIPQESNALTIYTQKNRSSAGAQP